MVILIPVIHMHRFEWIIRNSDGIILDIGCNDTSVWTSNMWFPPYPNNPYIKDIIFFDCDIWIPTWISNPKFVRGDAHNLPFQDNKFDTIVLGDILEHVNNPYMVLKECTRVSKHKIIITLPLEKEWNVNHIKPHSNKNKGLDTYCGYNDEIRDQELKATIQHPSIMAKCIKAIPERKFRHLYHLQLFNNNKIIQLLDKLQLNYNIFKLKYGKLNEQIVTYGVVMWKND